MNAPLFPRRRPFLACLRWPLAVGLATTLTVVMLSLLTLRPRQFRPPRMPTERALMLVPRPARSAVAVSIPTHSTATATHPTHAPRIGVEKPEAVVVAHPILQAVTVATATVTPPPSGAPETGSGAPADADPSPRSTVGTGAKIGPPLTSSDVSTAEASPAECSERVKPKYPELAREEGIAQGQVLTRLLLNPDGSVREVTILHAEPAGYFEQAVRVAALQWHCATGYASVRVPFMLSLAPR